MPDALYVGLQDEDSIAVFTIDPDSGRLSKQADVASGGGPSVMAVSSDRKTLYVGHRGLITTPKSLTKVYLTTSTQPVSGSTSTSVMWQPFGKAEGGPS